MLPELQWWQWLAAAITALGLSPAPWVAAVLAGRLMTLKQHESRVADVKAAHVVVLAEKERQITAGEKAHADEVARLDARHAATVARLQEERTYERTAKDLERERSDKIADKLSEVTEEFGQTTVHLLKSLGEVGGDGR